MRKTARRRRRAARWRRSCPRPRRRGDSPRIATSCGRAIELLPPELQAVLRAQPRRARAPRQRSRSLAQRRVGRRSESLRRLRRERATARIRSPRCRASTTPRSRSSASPSLRRARPAAVARRWRSSATCGARSRASRATGSSTSAGDVVLFAAVAVALHPGRASAAARPQQLRRPALRATPASTPVRARAVRALRVAPDHHSGAAARDHQPARLRFDVAAGQPSSWSPPILEGRQRRHRRQGHLRRRVLREVLHERAPDARAAPRRRDHGDRQRDRRRLGAGGHARP